MNNLPILEKHSALTKNKAQELGERIAEQLRSEHPNIEVDHASISSVNSSPVIGLANYRAKAEYLNEGSEIGVIIGVKDGMAAVMGLTGPFDFPTLLATFPFESDEYVEAFTERLKYNDVQGTANKYQEGEATIKELIAELETLGMSNAEAIREVKGLKE